MPILGNNQFVNVAIISCFVFIFMMCQESTILEKKFPN